MADRRMRHTGGARRGGEGGPARRKSTELQAPPAGERFLARDFEALVGMKGLSEPLLRGHFELYRGYVRAANKLLEEFDAHARARTADTPAFAELKRRFGWEYNGVRLHELYFENLTRTPAPLDEASPLHRRLASDFGGYDNWAREFRAMGAMRGIGWVVLYHDPLRERLFNAWIDQHDTGHLAGAAPVLVMDVFEHAYTLDYGVKKADYLDAFMAGVHWETAARRVG